MSIIGTNVNGYNILDFIDSGGFGSVFKAQKDGELYAIKIFREDYVLKEFREKGDNNRIKREIDIMKSVNHPNLIKYVDDFKADSMGVTSYFLVMEFAHGITLRKILQSKLLDEKTLKKIFSQILYGIENLHNINGDDENKGIIHRDLKPENIIVGDNNSVKILDYGISKIIDFTSITSTGDVMGSPLYMSPEQITDSKHIDKRSDLYTLGVIFYEMLTGKLPYEFSSLPELYDKIKSSQPIPPRRWNNLINNKLENIIVKLLEKQPYKRFPNINLLIDELEQDIKVSKKEVFDLTPRFYHRVWNEKKVLETFIKNYKEKLFVEFPANHQNLKNIVKMIGSDQFVTIIDPATMRLAYPAQQDVKGLQALPYSPPKFEVITPSYLEKNHKKQEYVQQVLEEQLKLGADILISPYHYIHNSNVPATQRRNPVAEWFDLDVKLLKESLDYKFSKPDLINKPLYAGICLNGNSLLDPKYQLDILNLFSAFDCDGYFIYVDCIDNKSNKSVLFHYISTLRDLQSNTGKPVIAGRLNSIGIGLLCAGIAGFSSGAARFDSFYENLYKEESESYNLYERYYVPKLLGTVSVDKRSPVKLNVINETFGSCDCLYCNRKNYIQMIESQNNKLHFLESIYNEINVVKSIEPIKRINYFIQRIDEAISNYKKLREIFKPNDYQHLYNWREVFVELNK